MTSYRLRDDLSFCRIDGRAIFLDTRNDRYFRLSGHLERSFLDHVDGVIRSSDDLAPLVERDILTAAPPLPNIPRDAIQIASRSVLESAPTRTTCRINTIAEVLTTVCWIQVQLKTRRLKAILDHVVDFRHRRSVRACGDSEPRLLSEALAFLKARKFVPIETCCLLDSLSIAIFLTRRHLQANIVFGVTSDPFSAHCWAQSGGVVLSDTIGHIRAYTVIRVI